MLKYAMDKNLKENNVLMTHMYLFDTEPCIIACFN